MNQFIFSGNLGRDAEQRYMPNGNAVLSFRVAVKSGFGDKVKTTWVSCGLFGKRAEGQLAQYLVKGAQVLISGEAFLDEWEKDGQTQKMLKVNVDKLDLIGGKQDAQPKQQAPQRPAQAPQRPQQQRPAPAQKPVPQQQNEAANAQQYGQSVEDADGWSDDIPF